MRAINIYMFIGRYRYVFSLKSKFLLYHVAYCPKKLENLPIKD